MTLVEERDYEPRKCANCDNEWGDLLPMDADDRNDGALLYCQECRTDFQLDNWDYFI